MLNSGKEKEFDREIRFGSKEYFELLEKMMAVGRHNEMALDGEILIRVGGESILVSSGSSETGSQDPASGNDG